MRRGASGVWAGRAFGFAGFLIFLSLAVSASAVSTYQNDVWRSKDGLPQNTINGICQTADGYLWLATQEGLARFDGLVFTIFDKRIIPDLRVGYFTSLAPSREGQLLAGTFREGLFRLVKGTFQPLPLNPYIQDYVIHAIQEQPDGSLWIGTDQGLYLFRDEEFRPVSMVPGFENADIRALLSSDNGAIWVGTAEHGLFREQGNRSLSFVREAGLPDERIWALAKGIDGRIWAGCGSQLCLLGGSRPEIFSLEANGADDIVRSLSVDEKGGLWAGMHRSGVRYREQNRMTVFSSRDSLSHDAVYSLYSDHEGSAWIGTNGGGLNRLRESPVQGIYQSSGLSHASAWTVMEARDGSLLIGTLAGGLNLYKEGKVQVISTRQGLSGMEVTGLGQSADGSLWVGTSGFGLNRIADNRIETVPLGSSTPEKTVWCIYEDKQGILWVGTAGGLFRLSGNSWKKITALDGLADNSVRFIAEDPAGSLWLATDGGLSQWKDQKFRSWKMRDGLPVDTLLCLYPDAEGNVWIGSRNGGLILFRKGKFTTFTVAAGIPDDYGFIILEDGSRNLWISCNKGVFRVHKDDLLAMAAGKNVKIRGHLFDASDGMRNSECNGGRMPAGARGRDGKFYFATMDGVAIIDPEKMGSLPAPSSVVVERAVVNGVSCLPQQGEMNFPAGNGDLEFHFTAPTFVNSSKISFQYRLSPWNSDWVDAGTRRQAFYTNIPPGHYVFHVRARNEEGIWGNNQSSFTFQTRPFFHQTVWFYMLILMVAGVMVAGIFLLRIRQLSRQKHQLEEQVHKRTVQLEEALKKVEELANTDGLTGVANRRCFESWLDREWRRSRRNYADMAVILADVDHFKAYNDTYGHVAGDECLKAVAGVLHRNTRRATELVGRYGGEEFILVLPATPLSGATVVIERIQEELRCLNLPHRSSPVADRVTLSMGVVAGTPRADFPPLQLIQMADKALYEAKQAGRNGYRVAAYDTIQ